MKRAIALFTIIVICVAVLSGCADTSAITGVSLDNALELRQGDTYTLEPHWEFTKEDLPDERKAQLLEAASLEWTVTDTSIAKVQDGVVTALQTGETDIILNYKLQAEEKTATVHIVVLPPLAENIGLAPTAGTCEVGETIAIQITVTPSNADAELKFTSENPEIATVDNDGVITAVSAGTTNIAITGAINFNAKFEITVTKKATTPSGGSNNNQKPATSGGTSGGTSDTTPAATPTPDPAPSAGHVHNIVLGWEEYEPTCGTNGTRYYVCTMCSYTYSEPCTKEVSHYWTLFDCYYCGTPKPE